VREIGSARSVADATSTTVTFTTSPSTVVRHFYSGNKVVLDVLQPTDNRSPPALPTPVQTAAVEQPEPDTATTALTASEPVLPTLAATPPDVPTESAPEPALAAQASTGDAQPAPAAQPTTEVVTETLTETAAAGAETTNAEAGAPAAPVVLLPPVPGAGIGGLPSALTVPGATAAQSAAAALQTLAEGGDEGIARSLRFSWPGPVGAAVFRRAGALWVVFDEQRSIDVAGVMRDGGELIDNVRQLGVPGATVLRIDTPEGINPDIQREGFDWVFEMKRQPAAVLATINVNAEPRSSVGPRLFLQVQEPTKAVAFTDPEVGDTLVAVPIVPLGQGVARSFTYPQLRIRPSLQGIALEPRADGIRIRPLRQGVEITFAGDGRFSISSSEQKDEGPPERPMSRILDLEPWGEPSFATFEDRRRTVLREIANAPAEEKQERRFDLARYYIANRFGAEALGVLALMKEDNPNIDGNAEYHMLWGIGKQFLARNTEALEAFQHPSVRGTDEAIFWAAVARVQLTQPLSDLALRGFRERGSIPDPYPRRLRVPLEIIILESVVRLGDIRRAEQYLGVLREGQPEGPPELDENGDPIVDEEADEEVTEEVAEETTEEALAEETDVAASDDSALDPESPEGRDASIEDQEAEKDPPLRLTRAEIAQVDFIEGLLRDAVGDIDGAIGKFEEAEAGPHRPTRARSAYTRVERQLEIGRMTAAEALEEYERLRFAWRGDTFEFNLLRRMGTLYVEDEQFRAGLNTLRQAATHFREHPGAEKITEQMAEIFQALYLEGRADVLPPITAIAIYDEFKELTPAGDRGDELIQKLADRLVNVDLLADAAALLEGQVEFRLEGVEKARVGARLALVRIMNHDYQTALETLGTTETEGLSPEFLAQRRHLRARALIGLEQVDAAMALLAEDESIDANLLRVEVFWDAGDWNSAAKAFRDLAKSYGAKAKQPLTERQSRTILDLATAFTLSGNERALGKLRVDFGPQMAQSPYADAFGLIASPSNFDLIDRDRIPQTVQTAADFQTFLNSYRERLANKPLSAIN